MASESVDSGLGTKHCGEPVISKEQRTVWLLLAFTGLLDTELQTFPILLQIFVPAADLVFESCVDQKYLIYMIAKAVSDKAFPAYLNFNNIKSKKAQVSVSLLPLFLHRYYFTPNSKQANRKGVVCTVLVHKYEQAHQQC